MSHGDCTLCSRAEEAMQIIAREGLKDLAERFMARTGSMPSKYFPVRTPENFIWQHRLRTLYGPTRTVDDPTLVETAMYLHALDDLCEGVIAEWQKEFVRTKEAEEKIKDLEKQLEESRAEIMQAKEQAAKALQMASVSGKGKVPESSPQLEIGECSRAPQLRTTPRMRTFTIPFPSQQHEDLPGVPLLSPSLRQAVDRVVSGNTSLHVAFSDHGSTEAEVELRLWMMTTAVGRAVRKMKMPTLR